MKKSEVEHSLVSILQIRKFQLQENANSERNIYNNIYFISKENIMKNKDIFHLLSATFRVYY